MRSTSPETAPADQLSADFQNPVSAAAPQAATEASADNSQPATAGFVDQAVAQGKKWLETANVGALASELPQSVRTSVRTLGSKLADGVRGLSTTQKIVGGAALAVGLGWLATRNGRNARAADAEAADHYREKFDGQPFSGKGKPRYAASAVQPDHGRGSRY